MKKNYQVRCTAAQEILAQFRYRYHADWFAADASKLGNGYELHVESVCGNGDAIVESKWVNGKGVSVYGGKVTLY